MWPQSVLSAFGRVIACQRPNTWRACCPVHGDRTPSLGIWLGNDRKKLLVRCWARRERCPVQAICEAVGLKMSDLFEPDSGDGPYQRERRLVEVPRKIVATYPYRDEEGRLLYEVVRYHPKDFRQRRPGGYGDWIWGLGDVRRVLFQLPLIVESPRSPVIVCEGEKDALLLESMGFVATCNPGGTGMGWCDGYSQSLRGRRVVVIPDNDDSGRSHADRVAGSLLRVGVESLRMVTLPGAGVKDVADWVFGLADSVDEKAELIRLVRTAREWKA